jgi:Na+/H+ antiporter NhaD/arsenite permease-like protein
VVTGVLPIGPAQDAIAGYAPTLVFLLSLFLFAGALEGAGALDHLARWILSRPRAPSDLPFDLFLGFGLVSAFMVNDALVVIGVPLLVGLAGRIRADPKPLLLVLAFSVTVGSTLTPFGNPQNLLVATGSGLRSPVTTFLRYLALPTALDLLFGAWYVRRRYGRKFTEEGGSPRAAGPRMRLIPRGGWARRLGQYPVLAIFPATLGALITLDLLAAVHVGPVISDWEVAAGGAVALLLVSSGRSQVVRRVNWEILLLFVGLFVVVAAAAQGGVIAALDATVPIPGPGHSLPALAWVGGSSFVGSQLVSNVPWVALQLSVLSGAGYGSGTPLVWMALAGVSTLAGNATLLGAVSNLIVVENGEKLGIRIRLGEFVREGLPLAAVTSAILLGCLALGL